MVGMEASVLYAAVTGMLKIVSNKLAPLVLKQYSSIVGVEKDLQELQDLVQEINCRLETAGDRAIGDAPWLKKLKEVAFDVDDVVDEFQLKAEKHDADGGGGFVSSYVHTKIESFIFQCKAAKKIKKIKKRFSEIVKQRTDLTEIFGHDPVSHINMSAVNMQTLPVGEAAVIGRDKEMHQIISNLVETNDKQEINIVSILGLGGSGKTTLAKLVFNDGKTIEKHFEVRLWVHVSQEFSFKKIVKKLYEAFADKDLGQPSLPYMSKRIQEGLTQKKFLIVMDDVWTESQNQWDKIMGYLKTGAPGSGVLLTTRSANVAEVVRSTYQFCLQRLSPDDSWQLFQQSFSMPVKFLESDFIKVGKEIVETCCGLPLAIIVLAGSLGGKELIEEWQAMRDILLDIEGEDSVSACLKLSYFHLPSNLKQCFTMCSLFPKGHLIDKQQLIDQWIAHDMISVIPGVDDLEHIGLRCFNSLVQVYFLQDVNEDFDRRVTCKMHDLIHDLARSILCEEISTNVPEDATSSTKGYRFFSLIEPRTPFPKKVIETARAIYVDRGNDMLFVRTLKNAKHLRSIIIENTILSTPALMTIFEVKILKYLKVSKLQCEALPEAITDIWSLQALYLESSNILELPQSIGKLKKLRTLNLSWCSKLKCLPDSIGDCQMLSTLDLKDCDAFEDLPNSIGRNKRLRVLRLVSTGIRRLPSSITTLENLEYLKIKKCLQLVRLPEGIGNLTNLKELDLDSFKRLPPGIGQLTQLEKLNRFCVETDKKYARISELGTLSRISGKLSICFLRDLTDQSEAHQACLKQKEKLHDLKLSWGFLRNTENLGHEMVALDGLEPPLGIGRIKICNYGGGRFASWMLKKASGGVGGHGPFPFLTKMSLEGFPNLRHLDGLVQLPCLEELDLVDMPAVESISGGPFASLAKVKIKRLRSLGVVWIVADRMLFGKEREGCSNHNHHQSGQLQIGCRLIDLHIQDCPRLVVRPHFPISLEYLWLVESNDNLLLSPLRRQGSSSSSKSTPSFSHLKVLKLWYMKAPLPLSPPLSPGFRLELLQHMTALESLEIFTCSDLIELPEYLGNLSSLQRMTIKNCDRLTGLPQSIGQLTSLQELIIQECLALVQFPESLCHLTFLKELDIGDCKALVQLPEGLGELCSLSKLDIWCLPGLTCLPQSLCNLMSLQELQIGACDALGELPECLGELHSLRKLKISELGSITCLPQSLCRLTTCLKGLEIRCCQGLTSLPEGIKGLTSLQRLVIDCCPDLERRCQRGNGEDWHLISHIPNLQIGEACDEGPAF